MTAILGRLKDYSVQLVMARTKSRYVTRRKRLFSSGLMNQQTPGSTSPDRLLRADSSNLRTDRRGIRSHSDTSGTLTY
jgi:hypothetical protein